MKPPTSSLKPAILTALALTFSCSNGNAPNGPDYEQQKSSSSQKYEQPSSSSVKASSSSVKKSSSSTQTQGNIPAGYQKIPYKGYIYSGCVGVVKLSTCEEKGTLEGSVDYYSKSGDWPMVDEHLFYVDNEGQTMENTISQNVAINGQYNPCLSMPKAKYVDGTYISHSMFPEQAACDEFQSRE